MYKRHKILLTILAIVIFGASYYIPLCYNKIAEAAITVISITLAVYISVATSLLGSAFSRSLKRLPDTEDPTKSMLGVLSCYLKRAGAFSVVTIIISSIYIIWPGFSTSNAKVLILYSCAKRAFSALACTMFSINIVFMSIIMGFLVVSLNNAAVLREGDEI